MTGVELADAELVKLRDGLAALRDVAAALTKGLNAAVQGIDAANTTAEVNVARLTAERPMFFDTAYADIREGLSDEEYVAAHDAIIRRECAAELAAAEAEVARLTAEKERALDAYDRMNAERIVERDKALAAEALVEAVREFAEELADQWLPGSKPDTFDQGVGAACQDVLARLGGAS